MSTLNVNNIEERTAGSGVTIDGVLIKDGTIESTYLDASTTETVQTLTSSSGVLAINMSSGKAGTITLTENITDIDFTNVPSSGQEEFTLHITQHASSAKTVGLKKLTVNGASEVTARTIDALDFTMSTTYSKVDVLVFTFVNAGTPFVKFSQKVDNIPQIEGFSDLLFNLDFNDTDCYNGSGSTVTDLSNNQFNFTKTGSPTFSADSDGDKRFTGFSTANYLISAANTGINTNTEPLTITALVSESSTNTYAGIMGQDYDNAQSSMGIISYGGKFGTDHWQPGGWYAPAHTLNTKYLVTWVFPTLLDRSTSSGKIYLSGTEQSKTLYGTASNSAPTNTTLQIGVWKPSRTDMTFNGSIYAVAIWNAELTEQQIINNHNNYYSPRFTY